MFFHTQFGRPFCFVLLVSIILSLEKASCKKVTFPSVEVEQCGKINIEVIIWHLLEAEQARHPSSSTRRCRESPRPEARRAPAKDIGWLGQPSP